MTEKEKAMIRRIKRNGFRVNIYLLGEEDRETLRRLIQQHHVTFLLYEDRETELSIESNDAYLAAYMVDEKIDRHADEPLYPRKFLIPVAKMLFKRLGPLALMFFIGLALGSLL